MIRSILPGLLIVLISLTSLPASGQNKDNEKDNEKDKKERRFFFGGSLWAQISGRVTQVQVSPIAGYHITPRMDMGLGGKYMFHHSLSQYYKNYSSHIYGGSVFHRYKLVQDLNKVLPFDFRGKIISHLEYEGLSMPSELNLLTATSSNRFWINHYWVGGGLQQKIGKRAALSILVLYNLNEDETSPYTNNPSLRIGFTF
jgi:hypothetical protein